MDVIAFDVLGTLFSLEALESVAPHPLLARMWYVRILQLGASMSLSGTWMPFDELQRAALRLVLERNYTGVVQNLLHSKERYEKEMLAAFTRLQPWPEAREALRHLEGKARLVALSNGSEASTRALLEQHDLLSFFERVISVESVEKYKPHPECYRAVERELDTPPERCTLVAAHGWDVNGAQSCGWRGIWVSRLEQVWSFSSELLQAQADDLESAAHLWTSGGFFHPAS